MYCEFYKYFVLDISVLIKGIKEKLLNEFSHQPKKKNHIQYVYVVASVCVCVLAASVCALLGSSMESIVSLFLSLPSINLTGSV